jgi:hypothetical protein
MLNLKANIILRVLFLFVIFFLATSTVALSDGGWVWKKDFLGQAKSAGQQAVVLYFGNIETLVLQTDYEGELADFSWLIPTPSPVTESDVHEPDADLLSVLDDLTAPTFYVYRSEKSGCRSPDFIPFGAGGSSDSSSADQNSVEVLETIVTESYEINVLAAAEVQDLIDWLDQNEYSYPPEAETVLGDYILRGWYFLAVRIRPSDAGSVIKQSLAPIQISFETDQPVFPLRISSLSSEPETDILIHLLSDNRYKTSNVLSEEVEYYSHSTDDPNDYKNIYKQWMIEQVEDQEGRLYFVEYAGWLPDIDCRSVNSSLEGEALNCDNDVFVTRFRSYFSPDLFTDDIYFVQDANDDDFSVTITLLNRSLWHSSLLFANLFFLSMTFVTPKRTGSNKSRNRIRLSILMILCVLIF